MKKNRESSRGARKNLPKSSVPPLPRRALCRSVATGVRSVASSEQISARSEFRRRMVVNSFVVGVGPHRELSVSRVQKKSKGEEGGGCVCSCVSLAPTASGRPSGDRVATIVNSSSSTTTKSNRSRRRKKKTLLCCVCLCRFCLAEGSVTGTCPGGRVSVRVCMNVVPEQRRRRRR